MDDIEAGIASIEGELRRLAPRYFQGSGRNCELYSTLFLYSELDLGPFAWRLRNDPGDSLAPRFMLAKAGWESRVAPYRLDPDGISRSLRHLIEQFDRVNALMLDQLPVPPLT
ncbi:hypothetical protein P1X14_04605 [Sphingomonas sp. AOB5]|uniref:hypothetical protein n=1 Tax=Sphingomonas sp. AOB5 TaxID=3034017 RepID=UPI0023F6DAC3|nr:hypothetical protein [Sphingomonas sp. AOB5]MDF7774517.1 hypothetical protein [Sphingomonas sp. AOB5]